METEIYNILNYVSKIDDIKLKYSIMKAALHKVLFPITLGPYSNYDWIDNINATQVVIMNIIDKETDEYVGADVGYVYDNKYFINVDKKKFDIVENWAFEVEEYNDVDEHIDNIISTSELYC